MSETVEYTSTNINQAQKKWCQEWEAAGDSRQARVSTFGEHGTVTLHLHEGGDEPHVIELGEDGRVSEQDQD